MGSRGWFTRRTTDEKQRRQGRQGKNEASCYARNVHTLNNSEVFSICRSRALIEHVDFSAYNNRLLTPIR